MLSKYEKFKQSLNTHIQYNSQNNGLDIGMIYYILKDVYKEVENLYYASLNQEAMENAEIQRQEQLNKENVTVNEEEEV